MGKGHESLLSIANDTGLRYEALNAHCKKHQAISDDALAEQQVQAIAKAEERKLVLKSIRTTDARQATLEKLMRELENRDFSEMTAKDVAALALKAMKDTDDVAAKAKDQDIDIFRLMGGSRSGEIVEVESYEEFDPWSVEEGELVEPE